MLCGKLERNHKLWRGEWGGGSWGWGQMGKWGAEGGRVSMGGGGGGGRGGGVSIGGGRQMGGRRGSHVCVFVCLFLGGGGNDRSDLFVWRGEAGGYQIDFRGNPNDVLGGPRTPHPSPENADDCPSPSPARPRCQPMIRLMTRRAGHGRSLEPTSHGERAPRPRARHLSSCAAL